MKTWITLINTLTVLSVLSTSVKCAQPVSDSDSGLHPGMIYMINDVQDQGGFVKITSNISYTCVVKFNCTAQPNACTPAQRIQWLTPRKLVEHQLIYGKDSGRVQFSQSTYYLPNNDKYFMVKSVMSIRDVGAIHGGRYSCFHESARTTLNFKINVRGRDARGQCNYADQCLSDNCIQHKCMCDVNQVYDSASRQHCLKVVDHGGACTKNPQCTFKLGKDVSECSNGRCECKEGHTLVNRGLNIKMCYKIVHLNEVCSEGEQCSKNDPWSFCSVKNKCECKTGYHAIDNICKPFTLCDSTHLGENTNFSRGSCKENEWCSQSVCLCRPNYEFHGEGRCVAINGNGDNEPWYERYGFYIIGVLGAFLLVALFMISFQVHRYRKQTRRLVSPSNSRDHLNRS